MLKLEITAITEGDGEDKYSYVAANREQADTIVALSMDELFDYIYTSLVITIVRVQS